MQIFNQKAKSEYLNNTVSVKQYAYREDTNFPIRSQMEDSHFYFDNYLDDGSSGLFGVLDGHGGNEVVDYVTKVLPEVFLKEFGKWYEYQPLKYFEHVFKKVDDQLRLVGASEIGSTCCLTFLKKENRDTRAVMNQGGQAMRMTVDHKSSNEEEQMRVRQSGGTILRNRVMGQLAVTRAFGDLDLKTQGVSNKPDLKIIEINKDHKYLIIASDGLWDVMEDQKSIDLTKDLGSADQMTKVLLDYALKNGSKDNISILIIIF